MSEVDAILFSKRMFFLKIEADVSCIITEVNNTLKMCLIKHTLKKKILQIISSNNRLNYFG